MRFQLTLKSPMSAVNCDDWDIRISDQVWQSCDSGTLGEQYIPDVCLCGAVINLIAVISIPLEFLEYA